MAQRVKVDDVKQSCVVVFFKDVSKVPSVTFNGIWSRKDIHTAYGQMLKQLKRERLEQYKLRRKEIDEVPALENKEKEAI